MTSAPHAVPNFVQKAYHLLTIQQYSRIIHWLPDGQSFQISQPLLFQEEVLPKHFRHRNVHSFIRQLNMHGFQKCRKQPRKLIFSHPFFLKGAQEQLGLVRRKTKQPKGEEQSKVQKIYYNPKPGIQSIAQQIEPNPKDSFSFSDKEEKTPNTELTIDFPQTSNGIEFIAHMDSFCDQEQDLLDLDNSRFSRPMMVERRQLRLIGSEHFLSFQSEQDILNIYGAAKCKAETGLSNFLGI